MKRMIKLILLGCLFAILSNIAIGQQIDRVIAIINDDIIMHSELKKIKSSNNNKVAALEQLIDLRLREQIIKDLGLEITPDMISDAIGQIASNNNISVSELKKSLPSQGLNMRSLKVKIRKEIQASFLQQKILKGKNAVSDQELKAKISEQPKSVVLGKTPKYYHVAHILIAVNNPDDAEEIAAKQTKAKSVISELKSGKSFETTAAAHSNSPTASEGGDLGWRLRKDFPKLIESNLAKMSTGSIKGPIKNDSGFHIIKVLETDGGTIRKNFTQEERKQKAMSILMQEKAEKYIKKILRKYRDEAYIERRL